MNDTYTVLIERSYWIRFITFFLISKYRKLKHHEWFINIKGNIALKKAVKRYRKIYVEYILYEDNKKTTKNL